MAVAVLQYASSVSTGAAIAWAAADVGSWAGVSCLGYKQAQAGAAARAGRYQEREDDASGTVLVKVRGHRTRLAVAAYLGT